eukprot:1143503-Pelagomonas_calceolata.AAC.3
MGMEFTNKFNGILVVKSQLLTLVKEMLSVTGPTNTQKDAQVVVWDLCGVLYLLGNTWCEEEEEEEEEEGVGFAIQEVISITSGRLDVSLDLLGKLRGKR